MNHPKRSALLMTTLAGLVASASASSQVAPSQRIGDVPASASISAADHAQAARTAFQQADTDRDGLLSSSELDRAPGTALPSGLGTGSTVTPAPAGVPSQPLRENAGGVTGIQPQRVPPGPSAGAQLGPGARVGQTFGTAGMFTTMDADRDGAVTAQEHAAGARAEFDRLDADRDGRVTTAELAAGNAAAGRTAAATQPGQRAQSALEALDSDRDGSVSEAEHAAAFRSEFQQSDVDRDGFLSPAERAGTTLKKAK